MGRFYSTKAVRCRGHGNYTQLEHLPQPAFISQHILWRAHDQRPFIIDFAAACLRPCPRTIPLVPTQMIVGEFLGYLGQENGYSQDLLDRASQWFSESMLRISNAQEDGVVPWDDELETIRRQKELLVQWAQDPESAKLPTDAARAPAPFTGTPINPTNSITSPRTPTILGFYPVSSSSLKDSLHEKTGIINFVSRYCRPCLVTSTLAVHSWTNHLTKCLAPGTRVMILTVQPGAILSDGVKRNNKVPTHLSFAARAPQEDPNIKHGVYFSPPDVAAEQPKAALNEALPIELFESFEANEEAVG
ncbi:hypothetical protein Moror_4516 [Moniliophthora roreri MCA 2997]|uniref:Uncharacterized protein n=1 Tax=Moniliophthora roreri (strain MCA 2997) TaxID=1381753 RepID=V2YLA2_MONRO|nr:hypothetical protein Moror_4516 [Moniliophthora roreri MCA 2997]